jgi:hypothetical protein
VLGYSVALLAITLSVAFDTAGWREFPVPLVRVVPAATASAKVSELCEGTPS